MKLNRNDQLEYLKVLLRIKDNSKDDELLALLEISEIMAKSVVFPFSTDDEWSDLTLPARYDIWVVNASKEIYESEGGNSLLKAYSENGISFTYNDTKGLLSIGTISQLLPKASVPK